jgi:hypothetical protein
VSTDKEFKYFTLFLTHKMLLSSQKTWVGSWIQDHVCGPREMENISKRSTFGDFVSILTERLMQDVTAARSRVIFMAIVITRKNVQFYCVQYIGYCTVSQQR